MLKLYIFLFFVGMVGSVGYGAYWYYTDTQARLIQLRENNTILTQANERQKSTIDRMKKEKARSEELNRELTNMLNEAEGAQDRLRAVLDRLDLARDARENPDDLEKRINDAVKKLIEAIKRETTISPVTPSVPNPE
jgi:gas vesicle protein